MKFAVIINRERILSLHKSYEGAQKAITRLQRSTERNEGRGHYLPLAIAFESPGHSAGAVGGYEFGHPDD